MNAVKKSGLSPVFFTSPAEFRAWLENHHASATELWVGFHKKATGRPSLTWPESVDEALCFGWIDGLRRSFDPESYAIRFTPRKATSTWSVVNVRRMAELSDAGRVRPAGLAAFERRRDKETGSYSFEQRQTVELGASYEKRFRSRRAAWSFFATQPPGYRRTATWWVVSAKREETRLRRLETLIECSADRRRLPQLLSPVKPK